ncbi:MAG: deoxyguanosinetriphosphate triphosphohydrolase family protein [Thermomicrobiales bacterium]
MSSPDQPINVRDARIHASQGDNPGDRRSSGRRDRDRILYSSVFRRLGGITQVVSAIDRYPIHNRLTHTLEGAQIGRSLAEELLRSDENRALATSLGGLDPDVVEAAALAHDLGHPPFGHVAEGELDRLVKDEKHAADGFEGNAQTFRLVTRLAVRYRDVPGLNLTRATLCAILKYSWLRGPAGRKARKWGAYSSEQMDFDWALQLLPNGGDTRSLEADLMDWADDVAYAVHDVEDFYRAGIIPLDRLATDTAERSRFIDTEINSDRPKDFNTDDLATAFNEIMAISPVFAPYRGSREDRSRLRSFTSSLIDRYIKAVMLSSIDGGYTRLSIDPEARMEVIMLKGLTWQYVIESRALLTQRYGHKKLIESLFMTLCSAASSARDRRVFPEFYRELLEADPTDELTVRVVADLIASMTESQVIEMHHRLTGIALGAALDPIVP